MNEQSIQLLMRILLLHYEISPFTCNSAHFTNQLHFPNIFSHLIINTNKITHF